MAGLDTERQQTGFSVSDEGKAGETAPVDQKFSFRTAIYDAANDTIKFSIPVAEFGGDLNLLQDSTIVR